MANARGRHALGALQRAPTFRLPGEMRLPTRVPLGILFALRIFLGAELPFTYGAIDHGSIFG